MDDEPGVEDNPLVETAAAAAAAEVVEGRATRVEAAAAPEMGPWNRASVDSSAAAASASAAASARVSSYPDRRGFF